jgi:transposase
MGPEGLEKPAIPDKPEKRSRRRGAELDPFLRTRLCVLRTTAKWTYKQIQNEYPHIPLSTIKSTILRESNRVNNHSQARSGRPSKLKEEDKARIREAFRANPQITYDDLLVVVDYKVGKESLRRFLNSDGLRKAQAPRPSAGKRDAKQIEGTQSAQSYETPPAGWAGDFGSDIAPSGSEPASATASRIASD